MSMNRRCNVAEIEDAMNITQRAMKRIFDIMASSIGLIVCSPVFLAVAIALKWKEKGSIISSKSASVMAVNHFTFINSEPCA